MPAHADDIEQERPAIELAVDGVLLADRRQDVIEHVLGNIGVPGLDDVALDHRRHFDERRLADIDVPGALLVARLGDEPLDAEALDRGDLRVEAGELRIDLRDVGMQVDDPLVIGGRQRPVLRQGSAEFRSDTHARGAQPGGQRSADKLAPVEPTVNDLPLHRVS